MPPPSMNSPISASVIPHDSYPSRSTPSPPPSHTLLPSLSRYSYKIHPEGSLIRKRSRGTSLVHNALGSRSAQYRRGQKSAPSSPVAVVQAPHSAFEDVLPVPRHSEQTSPTLSPPSPPCVEPSLQSTSSRARARSRSSRSPSPSQSRTSSVSGGSRRQATTSPQRNRPVAQPGPPSRSTGSPASNNRSAGAVLAPRVEEAVHTFATEVGAPRLVKRDAQSRVFRDFAGWLGGRCVSPASAHAWSVMIDAVCEEAHGDARRLEQLQSECVRAVVGRVVTVGEKESPKIVSTNQRRQAGRDPGPPTLMRVFDTVMVLSDMRSLAGMETDASA